ncbi:hypothetical protein HHI36_014136 [Cryptolaemus montrouzieri]|uniref:Uncharacterized protein n=1 Tax=Cryptolaemus montrouzieri TaxID=559131 RepID=A0ABD2N2B1_9CUCU
MMQIRRKSFKPFKKPLKVISEEKSEELENEKVSKKKVPEKVVQKARGNGKLKDRKLSENSEDLIDKGNGVFVKCDYTSMKEARVTNNVQTNNSPNEEKEIQESEVTIKNSSGKINASAKTSTKNSAKEVEIKSKNIVENKIQQENQIDKKHSKKKPSRASAENIADNLNQSASERPLRSRKVEIISQIVLENSKSTEVKLPGKSANTSDTTKMKSAKIQENPTKSSASLTKPTRKKGETVKKVSNVKITASGKSSSNTNENRLRSSPRVSVPPRKLDDYHTPLKGEKNGLGGTVQKQTSFMKRQANTPLSAIGKRSSKRTLFAGRTPRRPSKTPTVLFSPKKKVSRGSIRKSTNKYSEVVLSKKRRSESPVSLLKDRPNKIPKTSSEQKSTRQKSELISEQSDNNSRASTDEKSNRKIKSMRVNRNLNKMQPRFSATKNTHSERRKNLRRSVMAWRKLNEKERNTELSKTNSDKSKQSTASDESEEESISEKNVIEKKKLKETKELRISKSRSKQFGEKQESLRKNSQKSHTIKKEKSRRNRDLKTNVEEESDNSYSKEERSMKKHELRHTVHRESSSKDKTSKRLVKTKVDTKKKYRETKKSEEQISISSSEEKDNSKQKREANNISVREVLSLNRVQVSNKKVARNMSPKTLRSDKNSKSDCDLKRGNGVLRSLNSTLNKIDSLTVTPMNRSKNISKTSINNILNGLSKSVSKRCGDLSMKESTPHTTVTRSQRLNGKLKSIENKSSRKRLEMSSSEDETILKTFLQGDEELQILEETLIEDVTSRSNSSGCSKKENLSINSSTSSGSYNKIRRNVRRRTRPKDTSPTNSGSPRRKILRTSQNRILRSVAH